MSVQVINNEKTRLKDVLWKKFEFGFQVLRYFIYLINMGIGWTRQKSFVQEQSNSKPCMLKYGGWNFKKLKKENLADFILVWDNKRGFRHWILSSLLRLKWSHLLNMIDPYISRTSVVVDMGCGIGYLTRPLSLRAETIGLDIDKESIRFAKSRYREIDFVCCDLCNLPLRPSSVNIVVCASVLEHLESLESAIEEISSVTASKGKLGIGYPIETKWLEVIIKSFWKSSAQVWDQSRISEKKEKSRNPHVHKQSYLSIRELLELTFYPIKCRKMPVTPFPDSLAIYENVIFQKRPSNNDLR